MTYNPPGGQSPSRSPGSAPAPWQMRLGYEVEEVRCAHTLSAEDGLPLYSARESMRIKNKGNWAVERIREIRGAESRLDFFFEKARAGVPFRGNPTPLLIRPLVQSMGMITEGMIEEFGPPSPVILRHLVEQAFEELSRGTALVIHDGGNYYFSCGVALCRIHSYGIICQNSAMTEKYAAKIHKEGRGLANYITDEFRAQSRSSASLSSGVSPGFGRRLGELSGYLKEWMADGAVPQPDFFGMIDAFIQEADLDLDADLGQDVGTLLPPGPPSDPGASRIRENLDLAKPRKTARTLPAFEDPGAWKSTAPTSVIRPAARGTARPSGSLAPWQLRLGYELEEVFSAYTESKGMYSMAREDGVYLLSDAEAEQIRDTGGWAVEQIREIDADLADLFEDALEGIPCPGKAPAQGDTYMVAWLVSMNRMRKRLHRLMMDVRFAVKTRGIRYLDCGVMLCRLHVCGVIRPDSPVPQKYLQEVWRASEALEEYVTTITATPDEPRIRDPEYRDLDRSLDGLVGYMKAWRDGGADPDDEFFEQVDRVVRKAGLARAG